VPWEFPSRQLLPLLILKIFWKKIADLSSMSKEADLQLSIVHLGRIDSFTCCIMIVLMREVFSVLIKSYDLL